MVKHDIYIYNDIYTLIHDVYPCIYIYNIIQYGSARQENVWFLEGHNHHIPTNFTRKHLVVQHLFILPSSGLLMTNNG